MSNFLMRPRFNQDQNTNVKNFDYKLHNRSTLELERPILMLKKLMHPNPDVEKFDVA
jgi:hypothetical protein